MNTKNSTNAPPVLPLEPTLILMRHAARDHEADRLTSDGHRAASELGRLLLGLKLPVPTALLSSPKLRTQMTLRFLSSENELPTTIDSRLDERGPIESADAFQMRISDFLGSLDRDAEAAVATASTFVKVACSHFDWLELAAILLNSDEGDLERSEPWPPLHVRTFVFRDGLWRRFSEKRVS